MFVFHSLMLVLAFILVPCFGFILCFDFYPGFRFWFHSLFWFWSWFHGLILFVCSIFLLTYFLPRFFVDSMFWRLYFCFRSASYYNAYGIFFTCHLKKKKHIFCYLGTLFSSSSFIYCGTYVYVFCFHLNISFRSYIYIYLYFVMSTCMFTSSSTYIVAVKF